MDKIYQRNLCPFGFRGQAERSPVTIPSLSTHLGYTGMAYSGISLVQEGLTPPLMLECVPQPEKDLLQHLKPIYSPHIIYYTDLITF